MADQHRSADGSPFSWGIVGAGVIARQFVEDMRHISAARVGAVHTRSGKLPAGFPVSADARIYASLDALLSDPSIDAVYIASPNSSHAEQALAAIAAGKPVLVEKPLATTSADAQRIADAAARASVFAMEAMWSRFLPAIQAAREIVRSGELGDIVSARAELAYRRDEATDSRFFDPALGGGASLDLGVYPLSLALFLFGQPTAVSGRWKAAKTGVDVSAGYDLRFGNAVANLSCGLDREGDNRFVVVGTRGALVLHPPFLKAQRLTLFRGWAKDLPLVGASAVPSGLPGRILARLPMPGRVTRSFAFPGGGLQFEISAVMEAVRAGRSESASMPLTDSVAVLRIIETVLSRPPVSAI